MFINVYLVQDLTLELGCPFTSRPGQLSYGLTEASAAVKTKVTIPPGVQPFGPEQRSHSTTKRQHELQVQL